MRKKNLQAIVFGPQGSGKGTQGLLLAERFNVPLIGAGDLFRAEMAQRSTLGKLVAQYVTQGLLAPDDLVNAVMARQLKKMDLSKGYLIDGYPRNVEQAMHLDKLVKIKLAVQIKISDEEAVDRLSGRTQCVNCKTVYHEKHSPPSKKGTCSLCGESVVQRADDTEEVIIQRLKAYHLLTAPMAAYYRQKGILLTVNGEQPIQYVFEDIIKKIAKLGFLP
ncbi:adenylate kinase [Candidatus Uhrbacteria bacterium]|nr:adenylate kinase [Candidatus Uhrbacteria bacterium]